MLGATASKLPLPLRLCSIPGYESRNNDVVYCPPTFSNAEKHNTVVYFGGDVQDFPENMLSHRDHKNYVEWNLENTTCILHSLFPLNHIIVVRPSRISYKTFSCFENFVPGNDCGAPEHTPNHNALCHLQMLLHGISQKLSELDEAADITNAKHKNRMADFSTPQNDSNAQCRINLNLDKNNLILIGFSKGCVVLNQFLYEFHYCKTATSKDTSKIISKIRHMYWLDGGHPGGKNTWITSSNLLETLAQLDIGIHIHLTPYQINDDRRPWIRKEEKAFSDELKKLGAHVTRVVHFDNSIPSLITHFNILTAFEKPHGI